MRGRDGRGWRWRWRGPKNPGLLKGVNFADLLDDLVVVLVAGVVVVLAVMFLPFIALGVLEALLLGLLFGAGVLAATLFGHPILIRAEAGDGEALVWAVRGWGQSRAARDRIAAALRAGTDPRPVAGAEARFIDPS